MLSLAINCLSRWSDRVNIQLSNGSMKLPVSDGAFDFFVSTYVLDLLGRDDILFLLDEAHRILADDGLLCIVSLTHGENLLARGISLLWESIYKTYPLLLGGCRPIEVLDLLSKAKWYSPDSYVYLIPVLISFSIWAGLSSA